MDRVLVNARLATMRRGGKAYGEIEQDAIAFEGGRIAWIGPTRDAPKADERIDAAGFWLTPGLIDCHTHLVYAGDRSREFERRLAGATYEAIAREGGGIRSTIAATRGATEEALIATAIPRMEALAREGVTVVEVKSGYAQDLEGELRMLRAARQAGARTGLAVRTTLLALHALPAEFEFRADEYVEFACAELLPAAAREGLADAVDAFCDYIAFTPGQTERLFVAARSLGLPVKLHAEQLSNQHGAALAARFRALSADHLEHLDAEGIDAMAAAGTVAVLLPGAYFFLRETQVPPVAELRERGVPMAIASDHNPGTSPYLSLLLMLNMACTAFRLSPEEALAGVTREAAAALGMSETHGTLEVGKAADAVLWDVDHLRHLSYGYGAHRPAAIFRAGRLVARRTT
jgi:imidazolonepropionase